MAPALRSSSVAALDPTTWFVVTMRNGDREGVHAAVVRVPSAQFDHFLDHTGKKLGLMMPVRRLFNEDGREITSLALLSDVVYASTGEAFRTPSLAMIMQADKMRDEVRARGVLLPSMGRAQAGRSTAPEALRITSSRARAMAGSSGSGGGGVGAGAGMQSPEAASDFGSTLGSPRLSDNALASAASHHTTDAIVRQAQATLESELKRTLLELLHTDKAFRMDVRRLLMSDDAGASGGQTVVALLDTSLTSRRGLPAPVALPGSSAGAAAPQPSSAPQAASQQSSRAPSAQGLRAPSVASTSAPAVPLPLSGVASPVPPMAVTSHTPAHTPAHAAAVDTSVVSRRSVSSASNAHARAAAVDLSDIESF